MKITAIEKGVLGVIVGLVLMITIGVITLVKITHEAGGMKALVIDAGKEVKDIAREIAKD